MEIAGIYYYKTWIFQNILELFMAIEKKKLMDLPNGVRAAYQKAESVLSKGSVDYAVELLLGIVKREPGFIEARELLRKAERVQFAHTNTFKKIMNSISAFSYIIKGRALVAKKPLEALAAAEEAIRLNISLMPSQALLADAAKSADAPFIQIEAYEAMVDKNPTNEANLKILADLYESQGLGMKVLAIRQKIAAKYPNNLEAQAALRAAAALATMEQGSWNDNSSSSVQKAAKAAKKEVRDDRIIRAEEDVKDMIKYYEAQVEKGDESIDVRRKLADLYIRDEQFENAISAYEWIVKKLGTLDPNIDRAIETSRVAIADKKIKSLEEAKAPQEEIDAVRKEIMDYRLERAEDRVRLYPNDTLMRYDLAELYWELGRVDDALQHFQIAQKNPSKRLLSIVYLGRCFAAKKQFDMAVEQYDKAISDMPVMDKDKMNAIYHLGTTCEIMGNDEKAMDCFKQIYSANVNYLDVAKRMEAYYAKQNAKREAEKAKEA